MARPKVFVASSAESLDVAYAVQENLDSDAECTVWDQGIDQLSSNMMQSLVAVLDDSDFGIFVFGPDDVLITRGREHQVARDNVVLELGLFAGRLGLESSFVIKPHGEDIKLPSDLLGLTTGEYRSDRQDRNLRAALGPATNRIRIALRKFQQRATQSLSREMDARIAARVEIGEVLDVIVRTMANRAHELIDAGREDQPVIRRSLRREVLGLTVQITPQVMGPAGSARSCYLDFEAGPPKKLSPSEHFAGRVDKKRQTPFVAGTEHGDYVIRKVEANEPDFYRNLDDEAPPGFDRGSVVYKTFLSVPVVAGTTAYGLLTVDARDAGDLAERDLDLLRVMAGLVAAAMAMSHDEQQSPRKAGN
jgi:Predicted nucleotide-binding protein containing TIR-like domain